LLDFFFSIKNGRIRSLQRGKGSRKKAGALKIDTNNKIIKSRNPTVPRKKRTQLPTAVKKNTPNSDIARIKKSCR
jgi:hypothetical protein